MRVALAVIYPDYARRVFLREWLAFHALVGVVQFYLGRHRLPQGPPFAPPDDAEERRWAAPASVSVTHVEKDWHTIGDWESQVHMPFFRQCVHRAEQAGIDWIGLLDIDEFVVPVRAASIPAWLEATPPGTGAVYLRWIHFGTAGVQDVAAARPPRLMLEQLVRRQDEPRPRDNVKLFLRPSLVDIESLQGPHGVRFRRADIRAVPAPPAAPIAARLNAAVRLHHYRFGDERFWHEVKSRQSTRTGMPDVESWKRDCDSVADRTLPDRYGAALRRRLHFDA